MYPCLENSTTGLTPLEKSAKDEHALVSGDRIDLNFDQFQNTFWQNCRVQKLDDMTYCVEKHSVKAKGMKGIEQSETTLYLDRFFGNLSTIYTNRQGVLFRFLV